MRLLSMGLISACFLALTALEIYLGRAHVRNLQVEISEEPRFFWFVVGLHLAVGIVCTLGTIFVYRRGRVGDRGADM